MLYSVQQLTDNLSDREMRKTSFSSLTSVEVISMRKILYLLDPLTTNLSIMTTEYQYLLILSFFMALFHVTEEMTNHGYGALSNHISLIQLSEAPFTGCRLWTKQAEK